MPNPSVPDLVLKNEESITEATTAGDGSLTWLTGVIAVTQGEQSCFAMNNRNEIVMVFVKPGTDRMFYRVGRADFAARTIHWGADEEYEVGFHPSVTINDNGTVLSVQETNNAFTRRMFYRLGQLQPNGFLVTWGSAQPHYGMGFRPSVSMNNAGSIAEVHQSANVLWPWNLDCWYGEADVGSKTVRWSGNDQFSTGSQPQVSLSNTSLLMVVQKTRGEGSGLWYRIGQLTIPKGALSWFSENPSFASGYGARVSLNDEGTFVQINSTGNRTESRTGTVQRWDGKTRWGPAQDFGPDSQGISVGITKAGFVTALGQFGRDTRLDERLGMVTPFGARWMDMLAEVLGPLTLRSVVFPGTHDSGTSDITSASNFSPDGNPSIRHFPRAWVVPFAKAQGLSIDRQLHAGIRYFDLRVAPENGQLKTIHALYSGAITDAIDQISFFLGYFKREIVILDFQAFWDVTDDQHDQLAKYLKDRLGPLLADRSRPDQTRIQDLWGKKRQVILLYNPGGGGKRILDKEPLFWDRSVYLHSPWANTNQIGTLMAFLDKEVGQASREKLFVMQGVLTPQTLDYPDQKSLAYYASKYNETIIGWAEAWRARAPNIVMVDWCQYGFLMPAIIRMNLAPPTEKETQHV
ncbi:hypothetical protein ACEN8I_16495 [Polaromonas sp. CT11-55]|uniref:hypothetical protein n=1 Tax=Polaromonas sp. CT11-55 TaxID=3243045 RepID=UPI0039A5082F